MISSSIEMYLETLAGYIFDDDKLVTYKWLSKELDLHVNLSKQILWQFWKESEKRKELQATFALMGYLVDGIMRVEVVKEANIPSARTKFVKLTSEHLYSLQRALPDIELLALSGDGDHRQAAIICKEIIPRKDGELRALRWGSRLSGLEKELTVDKSPRSAVSSKETPIVQNQKSRTSSSNIFGKVNNDKKKPGIGANENPVNRGKKRQGSKNGGGIIKRKRQKRESDEAESRSSEDSNVDDEDVDGQPDEVAPRKNVPRQSPPTYKIENGKRKVRKIVDKTSMDSDGYFVTTKEYVYESCSDEESNADQQRQVTIEKPNGVYEPNKKPQPSVSSKTNRSKQASLLNFFKKS